MGPNQRAQCGPRLMFRNQRHRYFCRTGGGVFRSTNSGANWTLVNTVMANSPTQSLALMGGNLFASTPMSGIFLSTNNGTSWTAVNDGLPKDIYYSTQYGRIQSLASSGQNLFAGTWGGVFLSTNNGTSWTPINTGLPSNPTVGSLAIVDNNIFAETTDGVFVSTNNGTSWTPVNTRLTSPVTAFAVGGTNLFAGTSGDGVWRRPISELMTGVESAELFPTSFGLDQNYPNPFNPSTNIRYALPQKSTVQLTIFNALGQQVAILVQGEQEPGFHEVRFDASGLSSGVYFYRLQAGTYVETRKLFVAEIRTFVLPLLPYFGVKALRLGLEVSTFLQLQARASPIGRRTDGSKISLQVRAPQSGIRTAEEEDTGA